MTIEEIASKTCVLTDRITRLLTPVFDENPTDGEVMQRAMVLVLMRTIQATTVREDWDAAARENADLLVALMRHGFVNQPKP